MCGLIRRVSFGVRLHVRRWRELPVRKAVDAAVAAYNARRGVKMLCRKAALAALGAYAFAWGVAHPKATDDERIRECVRMTLWAYARGWL